MTFSQMGLMVEDKIWKVIGSFLATAAVASGTLLGATLVNQVSDLHSSISSLGAQTAKAVAQLSDLSDSYKELKNDISRALTTQHEDEEKISAAIVRQAATEEVVKSQAADMVRIESENRERVGGHP